MIEEIIEKIKELQAKAITEESVSQDDNYYEGRIDICEELLKFIKDSCHN